MTRYIRTKDGKIFDCEQHYCLLGVITPDEIYKQADTIEELIMVGDLVRATIETVYSVKKTTYMDVLVEWKGRTLKQFKDITELYTKQGNDYILVAKKENGEWRVI